jgi:hypothetical protein
MMAGNASRVIVGRLVSALAAGKYHTIITAIAEMCSL